MYFICDPATSAIVVVGELIGIALADGATARNGYIHQSCVTGTQLRLVTHRFVCLLGVLELLVSCQ